MNKELLNFFRMFLSPILMKNYDSKGKCYYNTSSKQNIYSFHDYSPLSAISPINRKTSTLLMRGFGIKRMMLNSVKNEQNYCHYGNSRRENENMNSWHNYSSFLPKYIPKRNTIKNKIIIPILTQTENFMKNSPANSAAKIILAKSSRLCDTNFLWVSSINFIIKNIIQQLKEFVKISIRKLNYLIHSGLIPVLEFIFLCRKLKPDTIIKQLLLGILMCFVPISSVPVFVFCAEKINISTEIKNLQSKNDSKRVGAIRKLSRTKSDIAAAEIRKQIRTEKKKEIRSESLISLGAIGTKESVAGLKEVFLDEGENLDVRLTALESLSRFNTDKDAFSILIAATNDKNPTVRKVALGLLYSNYYPRKDVKDIIEKVSKQDIDEKVKNSAKQMLEFKPKE